MYPIEPNRSGTSSGTVMTAICPANIAPNNDTKTGYADYRFDNSCPALFN